MFMNPDRLSRFRLSIPTVAAVIATLIVLLASFSTSAQQMAVTHCAGDCPQYNTPLTARNSRVVIHHLYAAGLNSFNRRADWVAYRLTADAVGIASLLPRDWKPDELANFAEFAELADLEPDEQLPDISTSANSYGGNPEPVLDPQNRVRLVPLTSYANTPYWSELNNTSNMIPMPAPLRLGAWLRLEQKLNGLLASEEQIHVLAGPVYFSGTAPGSDSPQPGLNLAGYFKVVVTESGTASFLFPHDMRQTESFCERLTSIQEIEKLTDLNLLAADRKVQSLQLTAALGCIQG